MKKEGEMKDEEGVEKAADSEPKKNGIERSEPMEIDKLESDKVKIDSIKEEPRIEGSETTGKQTSHY